MRLVPKHKDSAGRVVEAVWCLCSAVVALSLHLTLTASLEDGAVLTIAQASVAFGVSLGLGMVVGVGLPTRLLMPRGLAVVLLGVGGTIGIGHEWLWTLIVPLLVLVHSRIRWAAFAGMALVVPLWSAGAALIAQTSGGESAEPRGLSLPESELGTGQLMGLAGDACLVMVSVDTLRADVVSDYVSRPDLGPGWSALSLTATRWTNAWSHSTWTLPSVASLQTGLPPSEHGSGKGRNGGFQSVSTLPPDVTTVAEHLERGGFATAAVLANPYLTRASGLDQGFQYFDNRTFAGTALHGIGRTWFGRTFIEPVVESRRPHMTSMLRTAAELSEQMQGQRHYLWVHLLDAHAPYVEGDKHHPDRWKCPMPGAHRCVHPGRGGFVDEPHNEVAGLYRNHAKQVLDALDDFWVQLSATGALARCTVVFTADHGEELGEHGRFGHGFAFTTQQLRVPLWISKPGISGGVSDTPVFLSDLAGLVIADWPRQTGAASDHELAGTLTPGDPVGLWSPDGVAVMSTTGETWRQAWSLEHRGHEAASVEEIDSLEVLRQRVDERRESHEAFLIELGYIDG